MTQWIVPDTAHLFMAHTSLASWVTYVVNWLGTHGVPSALASAGAAPQPGTAAARAAPRAPAHRPGHEPFPLTLHGARHARALLRRAPG